jgi:hypothetical protein
MLAAAIALSIGCATVQQPLRDVADPAPRQILIGGDSASGRDSAELPRIYSVIQPALIRSQGVWWSTLEPTQGVYNWKAFDAMLACNTPTNFCSFGANNAPLTNALQPLLMFNVFQPPAFYTNLQAAYIAGECAFVQALLKHAPGRIQIVEFTNEPGGGYDWVPQCKTWQDIATFTAKLASAVSTAVLAVDYTVKIAGPSLTVPYDDNFFSVFAANGGFKACDIVTFHDYRMTGTGPDNARTYSPYQNYGPNMPNLAACIANCDKWSGGKPVCVSELGLGTPEDVIAYCIIAQRNGVWALCPTYWLGAATNLYQCGYWDSSADTPKPNGRAFLATMRAMNYTVTRQTFRPAQRDSP